MPEINVWVVYFATVAGIRFHPRNDGVKVYDDYCSEVRFAAAMADYMLKLTKERFHAGDLGTRDDGGSGDNE